MTPTADRTVIFRPPSPLLQRYNAGATLCVRFTLAASIEGIGLFRSFVLLVCSIGLFYRFVRLVLSAGVRSRRMAHKDAPHTHRFRSSHPSVCIALSGGPFGIQRSFFYLPHYLRKGPDPTIRTGRPAEGRHTHGAQREGRCAKW